MHKSDENGSSCGCFRWIKDMIHNIQNALLGWKIYFTHPVCCAGIALASLFMTVLGVDNITYGYCMAQCIKKSILGGLLGLTAIVGIIGSLTFPGLRKRVGLHKTGLIGFASLISMLTLCVVSIMLEGSPFEPFFYQTTEASNSSLEQMIPVNTTTTIASPIYYVTEARDRHDSSCYVSSFLSVAIFLSGIILARFGLWISDLTVTQVLQVSRKAFS